MDMEDPDEDNPINPDLRQAIYEIAIREGGDGEFNFLKNRLENGPKEQETLRTIYGLSSSTSLINLEWLLNQTISENSSIRTQVDGIIDYQSDNIYQVNLIWPFTQDIKYVYGGIGDTNFGRRLGFDWLNRYYDEILSYFGDSFPKYVSEIMAGILDDAKDQDEVTELQNFVNDHLTTLGSAGKYRGRGLNCHHVQRFLLTYSPNSFLAQDIQEGIENAGVRLRWDAAHKGDVVSWLKLYNGNDSTTEGSTTDSSGSGGTTIGTEGTTNGTEGTTALKLTSLYLLTLAAMATFLL